MNVRECCPNADIAFVDVSYVAENRYTGTDVSADVNPKISTLNAALESFCVQHDRAHFIDLRQYLSSNGLNTIDRCNLCYDGLHYSKSGNFVVADALMREVETLKQHLVKRNDFRNELSTVSMDIAASNSDASWPVLPEPAVKSNIKPTSQYPGQQYISVNVASRRKIVAPKTQNAAMEAVASGTRKKLTRFDGSKQQYFSSTARPMDKKDSKPKLPLRCQPERSRHFETDVSEKDRLILTNRFSVLGSDASLDDNSNDRPHADNVELRYNTTDSIPHASIKNNSKKTIRNFKKTAHTYSTAVPYVNRAPVFADHEQERDNPMFKNPYRVSVFSMLTYTKSGFIMSEENNGEVDNQSKRMFFIFEIIPLFLQALKLSVSDPSVQKLLCNYGIKVSDKHKSRSNATEMIQNYGSLIDYILNILLSKTRPCNATFMRLSQFTGLQLLNFNALYKTEFISYIDKITVNDISRNNFDIELLILCGDIETNPGPKRKAVHAKRIERLKLSKAKVSPSANEGETNAVCLKSSDSEYSRNLHNYEIPNKQYTVKSVVAGSFHQGDSNIFVSNSAGKQCACNALLGLCCLPTMTNISSDSLDEILMGGDQLYCDIARQNGISPDFYRYLAFQELPDQVKHNSITYDVRKHSPCYVNSKNVDHETGIYHSLLNAMEHSWSRSDKILMMIGEYAIATFKKGSQYYLFDSHSRNTLGHIAHENGTSILMKFDSNGFLINYLKEGIQWLCTETHSTVECLPVTITRDWYQLQAYFNDQATRSNKTEYNRLYKQKQRINPAFQAKENKKQVTYMRNRREIRKFRNKEKSLDCMYRLTKRCDQVDAELRQKVKSQKVAYMQTKRTDSKFRGLEKNKDAAYKQTRRENPELRAKDKHKNAAYKQTRRSNPEFRNAEKEKRKNLAKKQKLSEHDAKCTKKNPPEQKFDNAPSNKSNETSTKHAQKYGQNLTECVSHFHDMIAIGPTFVCTCCHQTWFSHSVVEVNAKLSSVSIELKNKYFTGKVSEKNREWLCRTCLVQLKQCKIPKLAVANGLSFPTKPPELCLYALEERLISLRIPFMSLYNLPRGGQLQMQGSVVNVPVDIAPVVQSLPRTINDAATVPIQLKRKLAYKSSVWKQNVRPRCVLNALRYLMTKELYKNANLSLNESWFDEIQNCGQNPNAHESDDETTDSENDSDTFSEIDPDECAVGSLDTMLDDKDVDQFRSLSFAPGEGQRPLNLFQDKDAEYLSFPTIYCGERMNTQVLEGNKIHYADLCKWELRNVDRRVANNIPNLFFKSKKLQIKQVAEKGILAMKRVQTKGNAYTAGEILDTAKQTAITNLDEGYYIFRTIRNSPPYLDMCKKEIMAMIRQLGLPTWFISLSAADTKWHDLIVMLGKLNEKKDYTNDLLDGKMDWDHVTKLVSSDPVTCARYFNNRTETFIRDVLGSPHNPIHEVTDYVYRVEFQHRGSPHIHMLIWTKNAPEYGQNKEDEILHFNERYVSCSIDIPDHEKQYVDLQRHRHSRSCRKKGKALCRFGFPIPPMPETTILEPYEGDENERIRLENIFTRIKNQLDDMKDGSDVKFEDFLKTINCSFEDYIDAVRTSIKGPKIFLQRNLREIRINPYMKNLVSAWKANHDIQFVLDPYACAVYITDYISKSQKGMSTLLHNACKEARQGNDSLRKQVRFMGNKFLNATETSAQEAVYLTLQLPLTKKTRQVIFINTSPPEERTRLLKSQELLENLPENSTDIYSSNEIIRYAKRPRQLSHWCLADYVSQLNVQYPASDKIPFCNPYEDNEEDDLCTNDNTDNQSDSEENMLNEIVDDKVNIELKNGIKIKSRKVPKVIRFVRYSEKVDRENFCREQLLLFWPWRDESKDLIGDAPSYSVRYQELKPQILPKSHKYDHKSDALDSAMQVAQNQRSENIEAIEEIAPNNLQDQYDDEATGVTECTEFAFFNPKRTQQQQHYDIGSDIGVPSAVSDELLKGCIPDKEYYALIRKLNFKQREIFLHINQWIRTKSDPLRIFLSGGAGTGKSVLIKALYQSLHRYLIVNTVDDLDHIRVLRCAPTGAAAFNVEGLTLHHAFDIPVQQKFQPLIAEKANTLSNKYKHLSVLIIDEISLISNMLFSQIDRRLQQIKRNSNPFGNIHILLVGDLFQLEPVSYTWIFRNMKASYGPLATNLWNSYFTLYELTEIMRQKDDKVYAELLSRLREGIHSQDDIEKLKSRIIDESYPHYPYDAVHMFATNAEVDSFNETAYDRTSTEKVVVKAKSAVIGDVTPIIRQKTMDHLINDVKYKIHTNTGGLKYELKLAIDLHYDCTVNLDVEDGLTNGATCFLKKIEYKENKPLPAILWVQFVDHSVGQNCRQKYKHFYNKSIKKSWTPIFAVTRTFTVFHALVSRQQFPLCPSSARTIHKCQGKTLSKAVVKMGNRKSAHSHYTALSRVTSLENVYILHLNENKISVDQSVKDEMSNLRQRNQVKLCYTPVYELSPACHRIIFQNIRSLHAHFTDITCDANYKAADVLAFAESRLSHNDHSDDYRFEGFHDVIRNDQKQVHNRRPPHGLALYVRDSYTVSDVHHFSSNELEYSFLKIKSDPKPTMQVLALYKSNTCHLDVFRNELRCMKNLIGDSDQFLIVGDFNIDVSSSQNKALLTELEAVFGVEQLISQSTTLYYTIIDLAFSTSASVHTMIIDSVISDHKMIAIQCWFWLYRSIVLSKATCTVINPILLTYLSKATTILMCPLHRINHSIQRLKRFSCCTVDITMENFVLYYHWLTFLKCRDNPLKDYWFNSFWS